jgi:hypothetical protein
MKLRQHKRALTSVKVLEQDKPDSQPFHTRDLCAGGLFLITDQQWEVGTDLRLCIVHGTMQIPVTARVVRAEADGIGVQFRDLEGSAAKDIELLIAHLFNQGAYPDEKRRAPRIQTRLRIVWSMADCEQQADLMELSLTGARVVSESPPPVGSRLLVQVPVLSSEDPDETIEKAVGCEARIVRHTDDGFAMEFTSVSPEFRDAISRLRQLARQTDTEEAG